MNLETRHDDPLAFVDTQEAIMENPCHTPTRDEISGMMKYHCRGRRAYIGNGLAIQYDPTDPSKVISADVFVALRLPEEKLELSRSWKTWEHGIPTVVFEVTSVSTVANDQGKKLRLYQRMGVEEYFLFDPRSDDIEESSLPQALLGYRRADERLVPIPVADGYESPLLGLRLEVDGGMLRFVDPATGRRIPTEEEARREAEEAEEARREAKEARREAKEARREAEEARREAEEARREAEAARERIHSLEREVARQRGAGDDA